MIKAILTPLAFVLPALVFAQQDVIGYPFGKVTSGQLSQNVYIADTSATAYVMHEYGKAYFDYDNPNKLIFMYHTRIKILKQNAVSQADIEIPLYKSEDDKEIVIRIYASSFNLDGNQVVETKLEKQGIFTEKSGKYYNVSKFAIPNVKAGSIIEYQYQIESPFKMNFRNWQFQSEIPKVRSEYETTMPANYLYNITLIGPLELTNHESSVTRECLKGGNGGVADCSNNKYLMTNIPAFKEEEFMLSKDNYISMVNFELAEVTNWDGYKYKYTKEWKDTDLELKNLSTFGQQLKKGKDVVDGAIDAAVMGETDPLTKAKKIYNFIKFHYIWNERYGDRSDLGIKKAFDEKKGNVGDINLSLVAALRYAGFTCDPVLLATRGLKRPIEIHPVLTDFNYVIAKLTLNEKVYLLDAVDDFMPFGSIPLSCYNGIGRVIAEEGSYWMDIKPTDKDRTVTLVNLKLEPDGTMKGTITETNSGYAAISKRKEFAGYNDEKSYLEKMKAKNHFSTITSYERVNGDDLSKAVQEKYGIEFSAFDSPETTDFLFNPFIADRQETNPFKSDNRVYPVDFAVPIDENTTIIIEFPATFEVVSVPDKVGLALPNAGGKYIFGSQVIQNRLTITNNLSLAKPLYMAQEYPYLKEIYSKLVQTQNADIIFKKKQ
jgi:transglutaminase-like putative cysteine protease